MARILVLLPVEEPFLERLRQAAGEMEITSVQGEADDAVLADTQVILGNPEASLLARCPALRWVQLGSAGVEYYLRPGVLSPGTLLTNATGAYGQAIGEYMVGVTLMLLKKLHLYRDNQSAGRWQDRGEARSVTDCTVLAVGLGDIGGGYAERMKALGAHVLGVRRSPRPCPDCVHAVYTMEDLDALLPKADIVSLSLPSTPQTQGLFSAERISRMKRGAYLLNVGRGNAVDTQALCDALESGALGGAGLDVTDPEPLPADSRLWKIENAIVTPHISGGYHLRETYVRIMEIFIGNIERFRRGENLMNEVDFSSGYCSHD